MKNNDRLPYKYGILFGPIILFAVIYWSLNGFFLISTNHVRGVHVPTEISIDSEEQPPRSQDTIFRNTAKKNHTTTQQVPNQHKSFIK